MKEKKTTSPDLGRRKQKERKQQTPTVTANGAKSGDIKIRLECSRELKGSKADIMRDQCSKYPGTYKGVLNGGNWGRNHVATSSV